MKRLIDVLVAGGALLLLALPLLVVAVLVATTSRGGVFFRHERVGRGLQPFRMWKFRSMVADAPSRGGWSTTPGDPRITRIGRLLRRTSLDELPQLINVLIGDMSLIGPRPDVPQQREVYTAAEWQERHRVRPGITGLAQATHRSRSTIDERKALDLDYVRRHGLWLDCKILVMTVRQVFRGNA